MISQTQQLVCLEELDLVVHCGEHLLERFNIHVEKNTLVFISLFGLRRIAAHIQEFKKIRRNA